MTTIKSYDYEGHEFSFQADCFEEGNYGPLAPDGGAMGITFSAHLPLDAYAALCLGHEILGSQYEIVAAWEDDEGNPIWLRYAGTVDDEHQWKPLGEAMP